MGLRGTIEDVCWGAVRRKFHKPDLLNDINWFLPNINIYPFGDILTVEGVGARKIRAQYDITIPK